MIGVDFDFVRYVARRKGHVEQRARDGAAYAYAGARKLQRSLATARPVSLAIEATTRLWKSAAKAELLGTCVRVTDQQFAPVHRAARRAAQTLGIELPDLYVAPAASEIAARTLGTDDDPHIILGSELVERLSEDELVALIGHHCGNVQNNHVMYATALYYLTHSTMSFVRWIVQPAIMTLQAWSRRAEISCDRAALLCARDLQVTFRTMLKSELGIAQAEEIDLDEYLTQLPGSRTGVGKVAELFRSCPYLPKRVQAVKLFSESAFYRRYVGDDSGDGLAAEQVDREVAQILSVF